MPVNNRKNELRLVLIGAFFLVGCCLYAEQLTVAVATNFLTTAKEVGKQFSTDTDVSLTHVSGSSGQLVAQILTGAPFDVFFSADQQRIDALVKRDLVEIDTRFTYATGQLVFFLNPKQYHKQTATEKFANRVFGSLVIANPKIAPYGVAAEEVLDQVLSTSKEKSLKISYGENVNQAFSITYTGNVDSGIVALSSVIARAVDEQLYYLIPSEYYSPIKQDAVILKSSKQKDQARQFFEYFKSRTAKDIIREHGYLVD